MTQQRRAALEAWIAELERLGAEVEAQLTAARAELAGEADARHEDHELLRLVWLSDCARLDGQGLRFDLLDRLDALAHRP
jgi:hypothetical protein